VIADPTWHSGQHDANEWLVANDLVSFAAIPCRGCRRSAISAEDLPARRHHRQQAERGDRREAPGTVPKNSVMPGTATSISRRIITSPRARTREVRSGAVGLRTFETAMSFGAPAHHAANVQQAIAP
jgi:hypothetical protein